MEAVLGWIGQIVQWLLTLVPHFKVVRPTQVAIKFKRGRPPAGPSRQPGGLVWWWPIVTILDLVYVVDDTLDLPNQFLVTKDGKAVFVSGIVDFNVTDAVKCRMACVSYGLQLRNRAMAAIKQVFTESDLLELTESSEEVDANVQEQIAESTEKYGLSINEVRLTHFCPGKMHGLVADWGSEDQNSVWESDVVHTAEG